MKKIILILSTLSSLFFLSCSQNAGTSSNDILQSINGKEYYLTNNSKITIGFENQTVYGSASVNRYFTSIAMTNNQVIIGSNIGATLMAGNEEDMKNESEYLSDLAKVNNISLNNDELTIKTSDNKELVFKQRALTPEDLSGREFVLENKYENMKLTISFDTNKVYGFSGVNRYFGGYTLTNENNILIGALGSTMMAGPEENMKAEKDFTTLLSESSNITLSITNLEITTKSGEKLIFKDNSITENKLLGKSFTLNNMYNNMNITIAFYDTNNQVNGFAGVNNYRTSYSNINNSEVKFTPLARTKKGGSEESMKAENDFSKYLENAKYMYLKGNELVIIANDSTILRFKENNFNVKDVNDKDFKLSNMFEGTEITLSIKDNAFVGNAGVNNYSIPFTVENNKIIISKQGISTLMAGDEADMKAEDEYLKLLNDAKYISYNNGTLCIKTANNNILLFN